MVAGIEKMEYQLQQTVVAAVAVAEEPAQAEMHLMAVLVDLEL
jgi:hypothetical protein